VQATDSGQGCVKKSQPAPDLKLIGEYERSLKEYPNIKVGKECKGYKK
jgi:hypothetical protein